MNEQFHRAKKDLSTSDHTVVEPIPTQPYTERPVTVIPNVYYREEGKETVRLSLGKDFSVTYRNNINVGTAELTIHGKGAYKGQFTVKLNLHSQTKDTDEEYFSLQRVDSIPAPGVKRGKTKQRNVRPNQ
jgi:hypothetical protein